MEKENRHREIESSSRGNIRKTIKTLLRGREEENNKRQCPGANFVYERDSGCN